MDGKLWRKIAWEPLGQLNLKALDAQGVRVTLVGFLVCASDFLPDHNVKVYQSPRYLLSVT